MKKPKSKPIYAYGLKHEYTGCMGNVFYNKKEDAEKNKCQFKVVKVKITEVTK